MKVLHIVGARPNFMKVAPVIDALNDHPGVDQMLVHTGQHYDANMSEVFFKQLGIPEPDINLEVGSGAHGKQTAQIMMKLEDLLMNDPVDWVVVYGDVNSTLAAALVCAKLGIRVAHVEAGLRSRDREMPEEINRIVTDQLSDLLLTPSLDGNDNLLQEGVAAERIHFVGNVMIDTLVRLLPESTDTGLADQPEQYALVTLHRPSNVDDPASLNAIMATLSELSSRIPLLFPIHPRTRKRLADQHISLPDESQFRLLDPVGYKQFVALQRNATLVITDSGGIQEETTYLGVPCITVRNNTERPVTVTVGTNQLVGTDMKKLKTTANAVLAGEVKQGAIPDLWDGQTGKRIAEILVQHA